MATNFSPCKGSYLLNQIPSNVMFGMNGFHVSASGAIQGHHGPLVFMYFHYKSFKNTVGKGEIAQSEVMLHSNAAKYRKILRTRLNVLKNVC